MADEQQDESIEQSGDRLDATHGGEPDLSYTQNRELSWLRFDDRVLDEAFDETVPLFERLKFTAIFESNLDEFLMVRVGGLSGLATLKRQPRDNKSGLTPSEQVDKIFQTMPGLIERQEGIFHELESQLADAGIERLEPADLIGEDLVFVEGYFARSVLPVISPLVIDPRHPFPNLRNGALYLACSITGSADEDGLIGLIEVPPSLPRVIEVPQAGADAKLGGRSGLRYILLEDVITTCLNGCFGSYIPEDCATIRVIRNADIDPDGEGVEEDEDYRQHMKRILKKRLRLDPIHLSVRGELNKPSLKFIRKALELPARAVTVTDIPLDLGYVFTVEGKLPKRLRPSLLFPPFQPQRDPSIDDSKPMRDQVLAGDKLLFYPYESMQPFLDLVDQAAHDDACISIRITLYRVAKQSRLCESLISAAEHGKDVTVLMELRARFDEQNNIEWAERLEEAGCTVIYGSEGFKCHSKICLITYRTATAIERITLLGTGNFNEKTAKLYSDFMLMTAHPGIGEDANSFFRNLSLGNLKGEYRYLGVAPVGLKNLIVAGLNREIERVRGGQEGRVFFKMNSLTDREVIDKIAEASQAGVRVQMVIRGISCLLPGVPGKTGNVTVRSIVGRFLEHARVYAFGADADTVYLSSADMMTRNTEHRVEIAYPVLDAALRTQICSYMEDQLRDNVKARELSSAGEWVPVERKPGEEPFNSQEYLLKTAYDEAADATERESRARGASGAAIPTGPVDILATAAAGAHDKPVEEEPDVNAGALVSQPDPAESADAEKPADSNGVSVQATLIEPEGAASDAVKGAAGGHDAGDRLRPAESDDSIALEQTVRALATRPRGRVSLGFSLIGLGLRTLFGGAPKR